MRVDISNRLRPQSKPMAIAELPTAPSQRTTFVRGFGEKKELVLTVTVIQATTRNGYHSQQ